MVLNFMTQRRFVLLDRDGTVIEELGHLSDPEGVRLLPGAAEALRELKGLGLGLALMTNQSAVGRGMIDAAGLDLIHRRMVRLLENEGVILDGIYVCPHTPEDGCECRKPKLGLLREAEQELGLEPAQSFMIGDKALDVEFGKAAGAITFLVRTGYGAEVEERGQAAPDYVVDDLVGAARIIGGIIGYHAIGRNARQP